MAKIKVYNMKAEEVEEISIKNDLFALPYNEALVHEAIVAYNANQRQGTKSALTRSEVRGHAKKPWRQKKTGRARHGSTKGPEYTGGGVVFAPKPRDFSKKMNKTAKRLALLTAISQKIKQKELTVVDNFEIASAKTKDAQSFVDAFKFAGSTIVVGLALTDATIKATNNIKTLSVENVNYLNTYDIVANKNVVLTKSAIKSIEEAYAE